MYTAFRVIPNNAIIELSTSPKTVIALPCKIKETGFIILQHKAYTKLFLYCV